MNYGHYQPETLRSIWRCTTSTITLPVTSKDGGLADATYVYVGRNVPEDGHHRYRLVSIAEYMAPLHPSLRDRADRLPCTRADGTLDLEMEATQRRREWAHMRLVDDAPFYEEKD